ncbi:MAG: prolipoprotein diacylglyceryl transferase [Candidatus Moranbacteria bacterium CG23_combo_of_CG06-09_8_20_14_all_35_22]|nr:MAG: prolipoprotein diacylglyceryl transferase [Candidatus Moranbacteria bacterium CG23_combo_of_CG06-09_8_20_14_all_35_22]
MNNFIYHYQHLPFWINPTIFSLGNFRIDWYPLMYLVGSLVVYLLLMYRIKRAELGPEEITNYKLLASIRQDVSSSRSGQITNKAQNQKIQIKKNYQELIFNLLVYSFLGLILGARLGFVLFYDFSYYLNNPGAIISPFDPISGNFVGIYGMSYHGGLLGVILSAGIFFKKNKKYFRANFLELADFVVPAIPAGYFFGRMGNFLNGELYGRVTQNFWGMYFPADYLGVLRHPSQLYEAFLEGIILFLILWFLRNKKELKNKFLGLYFIGYAFFRIAVEFFREPDEQIGYIFNFLTLGQMLSLAMLMAGIILIFLGQKTKECYNKDNGKTQETKID